MSGDRHVRHHLRTFLISWTLLGALSILWAIATPIAAAPDEPAHLIKAASVARGQFIGQPGEFGHTVQVPRYVAEAHSVCFAFQPEVAADCVPDLPGNPADLVDAPTTAGLYNPVYYAIVGWPSLLFDGSAGIYAMRFASALLTSGLLAMSVMLLAGWQRRVLPTLGLLAATTPMLLFLGGVVNPSGPEIAGTLAAAVAVVTIAMRRDPTSLPTQGAAMAIGAAIAMNMRGISPLWLVFALLLPLLLLGGRGILALLRTQAVRWAVIVIAIATAFALGWTLIANSFGSAITADGEIETRFFPGVGTSPAVGFIQMIFATFDFARGIVGEFGWLDISAPSVAFFLWSVLAGGIILLGCAILRGRALIVLLGFIAASILLPAAVQAVYVTSGGYIWQGRYTMPIYAVLVFVAAALLDDAIGPVLDGRVARRMIAIVAAAWSIAQLSSFVRALRRYAEGWPSGWGEFIFSPDWSPPGGTVFLPILYSAILVVLSIVAYRWSTRSVSNPLRFSRPRLHRQNGSSPAPASEKA